MIRILHWKWQGYFQPHKCTYMYLNVKFQFLLGQCSVFHYGDCPSQTPITPFLSETPGFASDVRVIIASAAELLLSVHLWRVNIIISHAHLHLRNCSTYGNTVIQESSHSQGIYPIGAPYAFQFRYIFFLVGLKAFHAWNAFTIH